MDEYEIDDAALERAIQLEEDVDAFREEEPLTQRTITNLREVFRIQNVYHSNAIEGNVLTLSETQLVVREGLTISGKPLKDHTEAINLDEALEYIEKLATQDIPIAEKVIRDLHSIVLRGIDTENAGRYRTENVRITGSDHRPPEAIFVPELMEKFGIWLAERLEPDPLLRAVKAHHHLVRVHPFLDGNGRVARILTNLLLMQQSFPITIIRREDRPRYYQALASADVGDLTGLLELFIDRTNDTLNEYRQAVEEERRAQEWANTIQNKVNIVAYRRLRNEYDLWSSFMEALRTRMKDRIEILQEAPGSTKSLEISMREYPMIPFEKYEALKTRHSVPQTWFFSMYFKFGTKVERFVFFFGYPSYQFETSEPGIGESVTLHISRKINNGYESLQPNSDFPIELREIASYQELYATLERDIMKGTLRSLTDKRAGEISQKFIEDVLQGCLAIQ